MASIVKVPLLEAEQTPEQAIAAMNAHETRAVCVLLPDDSFRLIDNAQVLTGWQRGIQSLMDISDAKYVDPLPDIAGPEIAPPEPRPWPDLERALDRANAEYGIVEQTAYVYLRRPEMVLLGTRSETLVQRILSKQRLWRCTNANPHSGMIPPGAICPPRCGRCGYSVKCA